MLFLFPNENYLDARRKLSQNTKELIQFRPHQSTVKTAREGAGEQAVAVGFVLVLFRAAIIWACRLFQLADCYGL